MKNEEENDERSKADIEATMTMSYTASENVLREPEHEHMGWGRDQLILNYEAVLNEASIYYPVCYRFQRELGRGRQGVVFLSHRQGARGCLTQHAIKIFDPSIYSSARKYWTDMGRIASQLSILQGIKSPSLADMDTYDEVNGIGYIQMEVITGVDLRYLLSGNHLEEVAKICSSEEMEEFKNVIFRVEEDGTRSIQPGIAVYILRMILRGLETLHETGFLHSDIKPANIMINRLGYIKIIDYGRAVKQGERAAIILGTPVYMSPEVHRREPAYVQSDIFSVGLVGGEMLCGKPMVTGASEEELLKAKMELPETFPALLPLHIRENQEFVDVLWRFLDPKADRRFRDVVSAETSSEGLRMVHRQLVQSGQDADYARQLGNYVAKIIELREVEN